MDRWVSALSEVRLSIQSVARLRFTIHTPHLMLHCKVAKNTQNYDPIARVKDKKAIASNWRCQGSETHANC